MVTLMALGLAAAPQIRAQFMPDVVFEQINVSVKWDGAGPEDNDRAIVGPLLPVLQAVDGVAEARSIAREDLTEVVLEFEPGWNMDRALTDVEGAVASVTDLPTEIDSPTIVRREWRDSVTDVVLTGPVGVDQLARFADDFVRRLFQEGVTRTTIRGIADPETVVRVETRELIRRDITLEEIAKAIGAVADSAPSGNLDSANARVRSGSDRRSVDEISGIVLRTQPDGTELKVGDIATVEIGGVDRERAYFVGDRPAIMVEVERSQKGDAIDIQHKVEKVAAEIGAGLPPGVKVDLIRTRSEQISDRLDILLENGLMGLGLVLALLFLFLNARTALWVSAGIPVAMLTTAAVMYAGGVTLNMISLFGLILTLGVVVDDAIVVAEHADFRARHLGEPAEVAAERAARHMAVPVFSSSLTTMIAFWGLTAIGGRFGELIRDVPITVVAVLAASLVECFLILPHHMSHALAHVGEGHWYDWPSRQFNRGFRWVREHLFRPLVWLVIRARYPVIAGALLVLSSQIVLYIDGDVKWQFWSAPERGSVNGNFAMLTGSTRADTEAQMAELQRAVTAVGKQFEDEYGTNPVAYVVAQTGGVVGRGLAAGDDKEADLVGSIMVDLIDADLRPYSSNDFVAALSAEVQRLPATEDISFRNWRSGPGGDGIDVDLYGADSSQLKDAAEALKRALGAFPEISALDDSMPWDKTQIVIDLTPQARVLGYTMDTVGQALRDRLQGVEAAKFVEGSRTGSIRIEVPDVEKTADFLTKVLMRSPSGQYVPLADLVTIRAEPGVSTVRRVNGLRIVSVTGDIDQDDAKRAAEINDTLRDDILPRIAEQYQVAFTMSGLAEQERDFLSDAGTGFTLCLTAIYLLLAWVFASWLRPLAIMAIIPFGIVGTIWGHYVWDMPMSIFTVVGLIGMSGIIINDSIVLISTVDEYAEGRGFYPAIVDAVCDRLRPILLTSLTTIMGLAPLLYETSQQAQFLKPAVITLVYGLGFGVVVALIFVPALLAAGLDVSQSWRAARRALRGTRVGSARLAATGLGILLLGWLIATVGVRIVTGELPVATWLGLPADATVWLAFALFAVGAMALTLAAYLAAAIMVAAGRRHGGSRTPAE
ncbi:MAG: efflux RND transporter permease subunit [Rhodobacteraceae bacterium]|nr:efflux RND transporter permease subunit [Paracoccaceae bacterium]